MVARSNLVLTGTLCEGEHFGDSDVLLRSEITRRPSAMSVGHLHVCSGDSIPPRLFNSPHPIAHPPSPSPFLASSHRQVLYVTPEEIEEHCALYPQMYLEMRLWVVRRALTEFLMHTLQVRNRPAVIQHKPPEAATCNLLCRRIGGRRESRS